MLTIKKGNKIKRCLQIISKCENYVIVSGGFNDNNKNLEISGKDEETLYQFKSIKDKVQVEKITNK